MSTTPSDNNQHNTPQMPPEVQGAHMFLTGLAQRYDEAVRSLGSIRFGLEAALNLRASPDDIQAFMAQVRASENMVRSVGEGLMLAQHMLRNGQLAKYAEWRNAGAVPAPENDEVGPEEGPAEEPKTVDDL